jgi:hypothetical protein
MAKSNIIVSRLLWMLLLPTQEIPTKGSPRMVKEALNDGTKLSGFVEQEDEVKN